MKPDQLKWRGDRWIVKLKLKIAKILYRIFPEKYCWADLVMWAFEYIGFAEVSKADGSCDGYFGCCKKGAKRMEERIKEMKEWREVPKVKNEMVSI